jgi:DNA-directed RNA polymerase specialized sigma24 family protein
MERGRPLRVSELLPAPYLEALLLEAADVDPSDIATRLGLDPTAAETLLHLARAKLHTVTQRTKGMERQNR